MSIKTKIKQYLDANIHDGEDREGCHCDRTAFTPDELQELVEEVYEFMIKEEGEEPKTTDFCKLPVDTLIRKSKEHPFCSTGAGFGLLFIATLFLKSGDPLLALMTFSAIGGAITLLAGITEAMDN